MIVSLGECLIDLIDDGTNSAGLPTFRAQPGGSPFNTAIAVAKLGVPSGFICPISVDPFGTQLRRRLKESKVAICLAEPVDAPTALAVVSTDASGHPSYTFHRTGTADRALVPTTLLDALPDEIDILHFGSLTLANETDWAAWRNVVVHAKQAQVTISLDPNLRPALIDDMSRYRERLRDALQLADIVKVSDEDLALLSPGDQAVDLAQRWRDEFELDLLVLTEGSAGAQAWSASGAHAQCTTVISLPIVDTVGAGDTFQGALLTWLASETALPHSMKTDALDALLTFAVTAAGLNCLRAGCEPPTRGEVLEHLRVHRT